MDSKATSNSDNLDGKTTTSNVPPAVYILVQNPLTGATSDDKHFEKTFPKKAVLVLSLLQLIAFVIAFISQVRGPSNNT